MQNHNCRTVGHKFQGPFLGNMQPSKVQRIAKNMPSIDIQNQVLIVYVPFVTLFGINPPVSYSLPPILSLSLALVRARARSLCTDRYIDRSTYPSHLFVKSV